MLTSNKRINNKKINETEEINNKIKQKMKGTNKKCALKTFRSHVQLFQIANPCVIPREVLKIIDLKYSFNNNY